MIDLKNKNVFILEELMILGIDIGGTFIKYGILDETGTVLDKGQMETGSSGEDILKAIESVKANYQDKGLVAVGVSAPGVINDQGYMHTGGAIFDFYDFDMKGVLETRLGLPVFVENDANCAALAEKWLGHAQDHKHSVTIVVGTGIGGGIIINNQIYTGAHYTAGEFGFIVTDSTEPDTRLSSLSLTGSVQSGFIQRYFDLSKTQETHLKGFDIFERMLEGDAYAKDAYNGFVHNLALGIFAIIVSLDPGVVLIGGAISNNAQFIADLQNDVQNIKDKHRDMKNIVFPKIKKCKFMNDAGLIGATYLALKGIDHEG